MNLRLEIDRLEIAVSGVSTALVEQALTGLGAELERRLPGGVQAELGSRSIAETRAQLQVDSRVDAHALCALIAERVLAELGVGGSDAASSGASISAREES